MTIEELTRDVVGYEGLYTIDIFGNVINTKNGKEVPQQKNKFGYMNVSLTKCKKQKQHRVHRLIAKAFIPNPLNKEQVNHIDGIKDHNVVWNLEWSTPKENINHAITMGISHTKGNHKTPIECIETGLKYSSVEEASNDMGILRTSIFNVLSGLSENAGGYHFRKVV